LSNIGVQIPLKRKILGKASSGVEEGNYEQAAKIMAREA
jgi:hypothetical protein